jgi:hypothetical protein
VILGN